MNFDNFKNKIEITEDKVIIDKRYWYEYFDKNIRESIENANKLKQILKILIREDK